MGISATICSFVDAPRDFNSSLLLHLKNVPISHFLPIVVWTFWNFRPGAGRALSGILPICHYLCKKNVCMYIYIYMVIDLKVLVKSFNCEDRSCCVGNPRESFFRVRESNIFFATVSRKFDIIIIMWRAATHFRLESGRRRAPENFGLVLVQCPVWCAFGQSLSPW